MYRREEIYQHIVGLMEKMFELDVTSVTEDSHLYKDLDIDSIDAIDLIVELKNFTGEKISPEDFKNARTLGDIVTAVEAILADD